MTTPKIASRMRGKPLSPPERKTLHDLLMLAIPSTEVALRFAAVHGNAPDYGTIKRWRKKFGAPDAPCSRGTPIRPKAKPDDGRCVRCRVARATLTGVPVGLSGKVCLRCHKAVIEEHREDEWRVTRAKIAACAERRRASA